MTPAWLRRGCFQSEDMLSSEYRWKRDQGKGSPMARLQRSSGGGKKKKSDFTQRTALLERLNMAEFLEDRTETWIVLFGYERSRRSLRGIYVCSTALSFNKQANLQQKGNKSTGSDARKSFML